MRLTFILFLVFINVTAQNIKGIVLDSETNTPIEDANIVIDKNNGTSTNNKGQYFLRLKHNIKSTDTIQFSCIGYSSEKITYSKLKTLNFIIHLSKKTEVLNEVTINSKKQLNNSVTFHKINRLKNGIHNFGAVLINNKIYIIAGDLTHFIETGKKAIDAISYITEPTTKDFMREFRKNYSWETYSDKLYTFDIVNNTIETSSIPFRKRAYHTIVNYNNNIYVLGGKRLSDNRLFEYLDDKIEVFNIDSNEKIIDDTNPHQAVNFASFSYKDNIIVMGGSTKLKNNNTKEFTNTSHIYNITTGLWYELPKMTKPKEVNGLIINDKIYLIGGYNNKALTEIESYNLTTGQWVKEGNMFEAVEKPALAYNNNIIYIFNEGKIITYDTTTNILDEYKIDLNIAKAQMFYFNNKLYIIGGYVKFEFEKVNSPDIYVIDLNEFAKTKLQQSKKFS